MTRGEGGRGTRDGWLAYALGLPLAVLALAPFLYMVVTAVRDQPIETFVAAATTMPFDRFLLTSLVLSLAVASGQVFTSATAAYALARLRFAGRERVLLVHLSALMAPGILLAIPRFLLIDALGWVDRYRGLVSTELVSVTGIFLLRQFFRTIPRDLEDAARLDSARVATGARHARGARVRRSMAKLPLAPGGDARREHATRRGRHCGSARALRIERARSNGSRNARGASGSARVLRGAAVLRQGNQRNGAEVKKPFTAWRCADRSWRIGRSMPI